MSRGLTLIAYTLEHTVKSMPLTYIYNLLSAALDLVIVSYLKTAIS